MQNHSKQVSHAAWDPEEAARWADQSVEPEVRLSLTGCMSEQADRL